MLRDLLNKDGVEIGRCHIATLMKRMGIEALDRKPNTSKPAPGHRIYPSLLRGMTIDRPNQVWVMEHHLRADGPRLRLSRRGG
jgi:putative transposase